MYDSMIFYRSFFEAIAGLDVNTKAEVYDAIFDYGLNGVERDLSSISKAIFTLVKPQIDANNKRKENGRINGTKGAEYGKLGGRPKKNVETETDKKPLETPTKPIDDEIKPSNVNANANVNANVNVNDNANDNANVKREYIDYQKIVNMYNDTCVSFPRLTTLSDTRKKAIRARLNTYTIDDFALMFAKAEASSFLKGGNDRNWSATFDWMIKDSNMAKILDGNYDNKASGMVTNNNGYTSNNKVADKLNESYDLINQWVHEREVQK